MTPSADETPSSTARLLRFSRAERWVHQSIAVLMLLCIATAAILYIGPLSVLFGHRHVVETVHVFTGFALPVPLILGLASVAYRLDLSRLNHFSAPDWRWLRSKRRRDGSITVGKFNAGQKLNGALSAGAIIVLLGSGILMYFTHLAPLFLRTGATFVHDWFAVGLGLLVFGHIFYAMRDPESRRGMRYGDVSANWAKDEHAEWAAQVGAEVVVEAGAEAPTGNHSGDVL